MRKKECLMLTKQEKDKKCYQKISLCQELKWGLLSESNKRAKHYITRFAEKKKISKTEK